MTQPITVSFFNGRRDNVPKARQVSWADFAGLFEDCPARGNLSLGEYRQHKADPASKSLAETAKDGRAFSPAQFNGTRAKPNVSAVSALVLDVEGEGVTPPAPREIAALLEQAGFSAVIHTSYSHHPEAPRYRVILPYDRPVTPDEHAALWGYAQDRFGLASVTDQACKDPSRLYFLPGCPPEMVGAYEFHIVEGSPLPVEGWLTVSLTAASACSPATKKQAAPGSGGERLEIAEQARGRWHQILTAAGIGAESLVITHQSDKPCPGCPDSTDRFKFDDLEGRGTFYCNNKGHPISGDGFDLLKHVKGWDFAQAADHVRKVLGLASEIRQAGGVYQGIDLPLPAGAAMGPGPRVELIRGDSLTPEPVDWLWDGYLAAGKLHILAGAPGTGKTTLALALAATITKAGRWPDGAQAEAGNVLIWSSEDDPKDTLAPRLIASGAEMSKVFFAGEVQNGTERRPFDPATDLPALATSLAGCGGARLIIVDPIVSAVAGDSHKNAEVRRGLQPLVDMASRMGCAVLGITHYTKGTAGRDPVERITGSLAFGALARIVFVTAKLQDSEGGGRIFVRAKSNIGNDTGGFRYDLNQGEIHGFPGVVGSWAVWGDALQGNARDLLNDAEPPADAGGDGSALSEAKSFLLDLLSASPVEVSTVKSEANKAGLAWPTVTRAKGALGVKSGKQTGSLSGTWFWALPEHQANEGDQVSGKAIKQKTSITFGKSDHLRDAGQGARGLYPWQMGDKWAGVEVD